MPVALIGGDRQHPKYTRLRCNRPEHGDSEHMFSSPSAPRLARWSADTDTYHLTVRRGVRNYG